MSALSTPPSIDARHPRSPISRSQIEVISSRVVAGFGLLYGLQTLPIIPGALPSQHAPEGLIVAAVMLAGLVFVAVATAFRRLVSTAMTIVAVVFLAALVAWPFLALDPAADAPQRPWLWYLCSVATSCAAIAFPVAWAAVYTVVTPVVYGVLRVLPCGGEVGVPLAALDASYAIILGGVVLVIVTMLRWAASAVDTAQVAALDRYSTAVKQHATEVERVEVDSIVHDSVLTTLLAAANARTPQAKAEAAQLAANAIEHLNVSEAAGLAEHSVVPLERLSARLRTAAASLPVSFAVTARHVAGRLIPMHVADAIHAATVQAMTNSVQHAGGESVRRSLTIVGYRDGVWIEVSDDGDGFDPALVPEERLGVRVSIRERIATVGGVAEVDSRPGAGTRVTIHWPSAPESADAGEGEDL